MHLALCLLLFSGVFCSHTYADSIPGLPGERYDIGGYSLHINCQGEGDPTIVMDVGLGDDSSDWQYLLEQSAKISRTCIYDRPGYGWSDHGPTPRTSQRIASELNKLLQQANISPPYVLVGHSFAGFNLRLFATTFPKTVTGMILIDASHEAQYDKLNIKLPPANKGVGGVIITRIQTAKGDPSTKHHTLQSRAYHAASQEIAGLSLSSHQVQLTGSIPTVPLIVISRGMPEWNGNEALRKREKIWIELQQDLTRLSPYSQHLFANQSGHDIPYQQPEIIIDAISNIVDTAKLSD